MSNQPVYEIRSAVIPGTDGVQVYYRQTYAEELVDLVAVVSPGPPAA